MEWVETTGRTIEDAKEAALDELGVDAEDAEFEVLEEPKQGLFGRLRSEGRVRARVRPVAPPAKDDRRRRGRSARSSSRATAKDAGGAQGSGSSAEDAVADPASPAEPSSSSAEVPATTEADAQMAIGAAGEDQASDAGQPRSGNRSGRRRRSRSRTRSAGSSSSAGSGAADTRSGHGQDGAPATTPDANGQETGPGARTGGGGGNKRSGRSSGQRGSSGREARDRDEEGTDVEVALDEQAAVATEFLRGLVNEFGLTADITSAQPDDETVQLTLEGSDLGLLIGPKGSTLLAIQDLTRTVVQRRTGAGNGRIHVDVGGYRQKRAEALGRFALQVAEEVKRTGVPKALEPMSAPDRKVVHDALTGVEDVSTMSEGEDNQRRVVISPNG